METLKNDRDYPSLPSFPSLTSDLTVDSPNSRASASPETRYYASRASYRSSIAESPLRTVHDHSDGMHHELSNDVSPGSRFNHLLDKHRQSQLDLKYLNLEVDSLKREKGTLERQILRLQKRLEEVEFRNLRSIERARQEERALMLADLRSNQIANALLKPSNSRQDSSSSYLSVPQLSSRFSSTTSASSAMAPSVSSEHDLSPRHRDFGSRQAIDTPAKARQPLHRGITTSVSASSLIPPPLPSLLQTANISSEGSPTRSLRASRSLEVASTSQEYAQVPRIRTNPNPLKRLPIPSFTPSPTENTKDTSVSDRTWSQSPGFKTSSYSPVIPSSEHRFYSNTYTIDASRASTRPGHQSIRPSIRDSGPSQNEHISDTNRGAHPDQVTNPLPITTRLGPEIVRTEPLPIATVSPLSENHMPPLKNDPGPRQIHRSSSHHRIGSIYRMPTLSPSRDPLNDFRPIVSIPPSSRTDHKIIQNYSPERSSLRKSLGVTLGLSREVLASRRPLQQSTIINRDHHNLNQNKPISPRDRYARGSPKLSHDRLTANSSSSKDHETDELQDSIDASPTIKAIAQLQSSSRIHQQVSASTTMNGKSKTSTSLLFSPIARFDPSRPPNFSTTVNTSTQGSDSYPKRPITDPLRGSSLSELSGSGFASSPPLSPSPVVNPSSRPHSIVVHGEGRSSSHPLSEEVDSMRAMSSGNVRPQSNYLTHEVGLSLPSSHRMHSCNRDRKESLHSNLIKSPRINDLKDFMSEHRYSPRRSISRSQRRDSSRDHVFGNPAFASNQFSSLFSSSTPTPQNSVSRQYAHDLVDNSSSRPTDPGLHNASQSPLSRLAVGSGSTTVVDFGSPASSSVRSFSMGSSFSSTHLPDLPPLPPTTPSPIAPPVERHERSLTMDLPHEPYLGSHTDSCPSTTRPKEEPHHVNERSSQSSPQNDSENLGKYNNIADDSTKSFDDAAKRALSKKEYDILVANIVRYDKELIDQHVLLARARQIFLAPEKVDLSEMKRMERQEVYDRLQRLLLDLERELELLAVYD
ncbi:hypothetical protein BS47DRAFT_1390457 [Hydnum rufescens UP504]|uniref:Uncharacterized protein n=1 Tax=Hydnum rufescens UP504 TaxID=1448309 RepID=A0A9P6DVX5_9AGAM|nr:hypothetical protein BS47DRAFT_1390457 [Hydnum rufescens UP504]